MGKADGDESESLGVWDVQHGRCSLTRAARSKSTSNLSSTCLTPHPPLDWFQAHTQTCVKGKVGGVAVDMNLTSR